MPDSESGEIITPYYDDLFGINILALDGGGIYGLTEALLLRKLCEGCDWFLGGKDVQVFAGCSAGAINALLLARHEKPREAVLAGELEAFWKDAGTFSNTDPVEGLLSLFGITPWFSDNDFLFLLAKYFGDMSLDDLKQHVIVTTFNWSGGKPDFKSASPFTPWPFTMLRPEAYAPNTAGSEPWGPLCFHNLTPPEGWDPTTDPRGKEYLGLDYRLVDVAYAAAAPPGLRRIRGGIGDGGSFNANPAMTALSVTKHYIDFVRKHSDFEAFLRQEAEDGELETPGQVRDVLDEYREEYRGRSLGNAWSLDKMTVFSIGSGQAIPSAFLRDIDVGPAILGFIPTNPARGIFYPPSAYAVDPAMQDADMVCRRLLTHHFHRLNPSLLSIPTLVAVFLSRFPWMREALIGQIQFATGTQTSLEAVDEALAFLREQWRLPLSIEDYKQSLINQSKYRVYERWLFASDRLLLATAGQGFSTIEQGLREKFFEYRTVIADALISGNFQLRPTDDQWRDARVSLASVIDALPGPPRPLIQSELARSPELVQRMATQFRLNTAEIIDLLGGLLDLLKVYVAPKIMEMTLRLLQAARSVSIDKLVKIYDNITQESSVPQSRIDRARKLFNAADPNALAGTDQAVLGDLIVCVFEGTTILCEVLEDDLALRAALGEDLALELLAECLTPVGPGIIYQRPKLESYTEPQSYRITNFIVVDDACAKAR